MADVNVVYDEDRITVADIIKQEEEGTFRSQIDVLAKLVQNGDGEFLPEDEAFEVLKGFSIGEIRRASDEIAAAARGEDSPK